MGIGMPLMPGSWVNKNKVVKHGKHLSLTDAYHGIYSQTGIKCTQNNSTYIPSVKFAQRLRCYKDLNVYDWSIQMAEIQTNYTEYAYKSKINKKLGFTWPSNTEMLGQIKSCVRIKGLADTESQWAVCLATTGLALLK